MSKWPKRSLLLSSLTALIAACTNHSPVNSHAEPKFADVHFHAANYAYQGVSLRTLIDKYMSAGIARSVVMPLPLQQRWDSFENYEATHGGSVYGANYYIGSKADLYYYAFADAMYAKEFQSLPADDKEKIDLMITGFNPMDRYAPHHIKRALLTFPGVFTGIGEFTVHKEIVSSKVAGETIRDTAAGELPPDLDTKGTMSLHAKSLMDILNFAGESGLVTLLHNDIYPVEVTYDGAVIAVHPDNDYTDSLIKLCEAYPTARVVWGHTGLGRYVKPARNHLLLVTNVLTKCHNWSVDISWDLIQDYIINPGPDMPSTQAWIGFLTHYSSRVLWGSDSVIYGRNKFDNPGQVTPGDLLTTEQYMEVPALMNSIFEQLPNEAANNIRYGNYKRMFDAARRKVRAWEALHVNDDVWNLPMPTASQM